MLSDAEIVESVTFLVVDLVVGDTEIVLFTDISDLFCVVLDEYPVPPLSLPSLRVFLVKTFPVGEVGVEVVSEVSWLTARGLEAS